MTTKQSSKAKKAAKTGSKRVPSVKRLNEVRPLRLSAECILNK
jgi:hypothetical protein